MNEVLTAIAEHNRALEENAESPFDLRFARGRMFSILLPLLRTLLEAGDCEATVQLMAAWHGIPSQQVLRDAVVICARFERTTAWCFNGSCIQTDSSDLSMTDVLNDVLGLALVDASDPFSVPEMPSRPGIPNYALADVFEAAATDALQPVRALSVISDTNSPPRGLINLSFERMPVAHLLATAGGPALPLNVSIEQPSADRIISRAEIWFGDLLLAQEEAEAVQAILKNMGVDVHLVESASRTVSSFASSYQNPELDLLWVSSHAALGHWRPDETVLILSSSNEIALAEFDALAPPGERRRLLVLNSCESAAASGLGGPSTVGLAGVAAGRTQAVISHLWPVSTRAAYTFGVMLAVGLVREPTFFGAFSFAQSALTPEPAGCLPEGLNPRIANYLMQEEATFLDRASPVFVQ